MREKEERIYLYFLVTGLFLFFISLLWIIEFLINNVISNNVIYFFPVEVKFL